MGPKSSLGEMSGVCAVFDITSKKIVGNYIRRSLLLLICASNIPYYIFYLIILHIF